MKKMQEWKIIGEKIAPRRKLKYNVNNYIRNQIRNPAANNGTSSILGL